MGLFERILSSKELQSEKLKDYQRVVLVQVIIVVTGLVLSSLLDLEQEPLLGGLFSLFGVIYAFLLWDLLRDFPVDLRVIRAVFFLLVFIVILGLILENPIAPMLKGENRRIGLFVVHGLLFPIEILVIVNTLLDVFRGSYLTNDKLWGAACVFLMMAISFGSLYDLICIAVPGSLGVEIPLGLANYSECIYYSFNVLGGLDSGYPEASKLIRNIGVIEAVWGNLFALLIIGRLLTFPQKGEKDS